MNSMEAKKILLDSKPQITDPMSAIQAVSYVDKFLIVFQDE